MTTDDGQGFEVAGMHRGPGQRSSKAVELLEETLRSMVDGGELHPDVERVYAALCEAEARAATAGRRHG